MSYVMINVPVHLFNGCKLRYLEKKVTFLKYAEMPVGPLNPMGLPVGRYVDRDNVIVLYDGVELKAPVKDLVLDDSIYPSPPAAHIVNGVRQWERVGDLLYPIELWPGDRIKDFGRNKEWFTVAAISFDDDGKPIYELWNDSGSVKLILHYKPTGGWLDRGNVYHLYNDPENLKFGSDEEEMAFWVREGISVCGLGRGGGQPMWPCMDFFDKGHVDLITRHPKNESFFCTYKLHSIFAEHRSRVHALTERMFGREMEEAREYVCRRKAEV